LPERYQRYLSAFTEPDKSRFFSQDFLNQLQIEGRGTVELAMHKVEQCRDPLEWMLLTDMETYLPNDELRKADRLSMWHSLEVRVPLLDHKLVEFIATIPSQLKLKGWEKKHILIKSLEGILPRSTLRRRKQGFSIPLSQWLRGPLRELMRTTLSETALRDIGLFEPSAVLRLVDEHERQVRNHETRMWSLVTFSMWHRLYMHESGARNLE